MSASCDFSFFSPRSLTSDLQLNDSDEEEESSSVWTVNAPLLMGYHCFMCFPFLKKIFELLWFALVLGSHGNANTRLYRSHGVQLW